MIVFKKKIELSNYSGWSLAADGESKVNQIEHSLRLSLTHVLQMMAPLSTRGTSSVMFNEVYEIAYFK